MHQPKKNSSLSDKQLAALGQGLVNIYESGYLDKHQSYKNSFIKGVISGVGGVLGATVVIAILIWILSLLGHVPLVGPLIQNTQQTIESSKNK